MGEIRALFWDIGGVLLTNGWDAAVRRRAIEHFHLDGAEFEAHHERVVAAFEMHEMTLNEYLEETVFQRPRDFTAEDFRRFMFAQSQGCRKALQLAAEVAGTRRYVMTAINNESLELNLHRIRQFELASYFSAFFSSCFLAARKPGPEIYRRALEITERPPGECVMIDDRPENLDAPKRLGMHVVRYQSPARLREELSALGVVAGAAAR